MLNSKRWELHPIMTEADRRALSRWHDEPVVQQLFFNRQIYTVDDAIAYVKGQVTFSTHALDLKDVDVAVARLLTALDQHHPIAIYGDYDADGITATALLLEVLGAYDADVRPYIPDRFEEGYGLNTDALTRLQAEGVKLVITVDCGIRSPDEVAHGNTLGLDLIVTDHHHLGEVLPPALAVINPKREDSPYEEKMLAGVGVAFKLAEALIAARPPIKPFDLDSVLDLVALGSVADLAPLRGENRSLVKRGLKQLEQHIARPGLRALCQVASVRPPITAGNIGFQIGPRLNAAGRLDSALAAVQLLTTHDPDEAERLAHLLHTHNQDRQTLTKDTATLAAELADAERGDRYILIAAHPNFHEGVVGLAASRLQERYYRPALVATLKEDGTVKGSARSINEFHITEALDQCADLLLRHGGHAVAAGYTVAQENWPTLVARLNHLATQQLAGLDLKPRLMVDLEVALADLTPRLADQLTYFEPTGYGNRQPVFMSRNVNVLSRKVMGQDGLHLKLIVAQNGSRPIEVIAFRWGEFVDDIPTRVDLAYTLEINNWQGKQSLQLNLKDLRPASG